MQKSGPPSAGPRSHQRRWVGWHGSPETPNAPAPPFADAARPEAIQEDLLSGRESLSRGAHHGPHRAGPLPERDLSARSQQCPEPPQRGLAQSGGRCVFVWLLSCLLSLPSHPTACFLRLPGRSPGSRFSAFSRLPCPKTSGISGRAHRLQSRGRLQLGADALTEFPVRSHADLPHIGTPSV